MTTAAVAKSFPKFSRPGYRVDIANDGLTALELVQKKTYGLALIDYRNAGPWTASNSTGGFAIAS